MTSANSLDVSLSMERVPCPLCAGWDHRFERRVRGFELVRCRRCRLTFVNPQPTDEAIAAGYDGQGELGRLIGGRPDKVTFYETWFSQQDRRRWRRTLEEMARLSGGGRLLEYGCGPALVGQVAAKSGWQVEAIDIGSWIRELQPRRSFPLRVGTLREQAWPAGHFDAVYAQDVLEHLRRPCDELTELARILRPGGVLYVHVPNYASLTIRLGVSRFAYNEPPGHLNYFTPATLIALLHRCGLACVRVGSDHLEYQDLWRRGTFDYASFEHSIAAHGRQEGGRWWSLARGLVNIPVNVLRCGTYLWAYALRRPS